MIRIIKKKRNLFFIICVLIYIFYTIKWTPSSSKQGWSQPRTQGISPPRQQEIDNNPRRRIRKTLQANILNDGVLGIHRSNKFPKDNPCPYLSLRKPMKNSIYSLNYTGMACVPHRPTKEACEEATDIYGKASELPVEKCEEEKHKPVCTLKTSLTRRYTLHCDWRICFPRWAKVGELSGKYGKVVNWNYAPKSDELQKIIQRSIKNGFHFIFVKCGSLQQVLILPYKLPQSLQSGQEHINVNIILIDSVARPHFYRSMPKTIKALRRIVYSKNIEATVLDFELLQSVSQHTADNCRPLYSGVTSGVYRDFSSNWRATTKPLGISVLFGNYKKHGYHTMFQEEGCWYDEWGITLTDGERNKEPQTREEFVERWKELKERWKNYHIDDFGLTHFTCEVVGKYDRTNDFDTPEQVCYNGEFISTYYLKYHLDYLNTMRSQGNKIPSLHYLHLETGHTSSGIRIRNDDLGLASYVTEVANDPNTLTILLSDHGQSRTQYGQTVEGRYELFNPLMFIILPENVAKILGKKRVKSLVDNQRRLFTTLDIHRMLMAIPDAKRIASTDYTVNGLLSLLPRQRTCQNLPLTPMTRCKCEGTDQRVEDNSERHNWLAEFALGQLNNMIQEQVMNGNGAKHAGGYGSCVRLRGISTKNNMEQQTDLELITIMDIIAESPLNNVKEVFQVMVRMPLIPDDEEYHVELVKFDRHSLYNRYAHCVDEGVDLKLCACVPKKSQNPSRRKRDIKKLATRTVFGAKTEVEKIDSAGCLLLLNRRFNYSISYEVTNLCDGAYDIVVSGDVYNMLLSHTLPLNIRAEPKTIYFLLSATRYVVNDSYFNIRTSYQLVDF